MTKDNKRLLVACEMSGIVREAFREKGYDAWSCDILPSEIPSKYHIQDDVMNHLKDGWAMMIGHPVCTFICRNRARQNKQELVQIDTSLFMGLLHADIPRICIENPVPSSAANLPKYDQIIQYTYIITPNGKKYTKGWYQTPRNSIARSRTFKGIAEAMADQWGVFLI